MSKNNNHKKLERILKGIKKVAFGGVGGLTLYTLLKLSSPNDVSAHELKNSLGKEIDHYHIPHLENKMLIETSDEKVYFDEVVFPKGPQGYWNLGLKYNSKDYKTIHKLNAEMLGTPGTFADRDDLIIDGTKIVIPYTMDKNGDKKLFTELNKFQIAELKNGEITEKLPVKEEKGEKGKILSVGKGISDYVDNVWENYNNNDIEISRELKKSIEGLTKSTGDPKSIADDDFEEVDGYLNTIGENFEKANIKNIAFSGKATLNKIDQTVDYLQDLKKVYQNHLRTSQKGLSELERATSKLETLSEEGKMKIDVTKEETKTKIKELENIIKGMDNLIVYGKEFKKPRGFKTNEFVYSGDDDLENIADYFEDIYRESKDELRNESELFNSWYEEFFNPQVSTVNDLFKKILKDYIDPKKVEKTIKEYQLGNELPQTIAEERKNLEDTIRRLDALIGKKSAREEKRTPSRIGRVSRDKKIGDLNLGRGEREKTRLTNNETGISYSPLGVVVRVTANVDKELGRGRYWAGPRIGNMSFLAYIEKPSDEILKGIETTLPNGIDVIGSKVKEDQLILGGQLQYSFFRNGKFHPLIEFGLGNNKYVITNSEELRKGTNTLESNTTREVGSDLFKNIGVGIEFGDRARVQIIGNYQFSDIKKGNLQLGIGGTYYFRK